jgi:hypothetical protein
MGRFKHLDADQVRHIQAKVEENRAIIEQIATNAPPPRPAARDPALVEHNRTR